MKRFNLLAFLLGIVTVTAIAAKITTNELKIGQKVAEDITIEFDKGLGANNPFFKWNDASGALQFSNDGTNTFDIGSGAGGGGGVNFLVNGGFESGAVNWTNAGSGAFAETTAAAKVGRGGKAGNWDAAAASDTLTSDQQTVSNIDGGGKCVARWSYVGGDINITARVIDGALSVLASKQLSNQVSYVTDTFNFTCPASGTVAFELVSAGDAPEISLDEVFVGFIQVNDLTDLTDVSHAAPADKDVMAYDSATGAYYGRAPPATSLNYVLNDDLEISVTEDITNTAEISASSFVSTPLRGAQSVELITTASATTADYIGFDMRTFEAQDINKLHVLEFDFADDFSYAAGDLEVVIYDLDNAAEILPTNTAIPGGGGRFQALWVATDADDYEIRFKVATASTVFDKVIDNIRVGPVADGQVGAVPFQGLKAASSSITALTTNLEYNEAFYSRSGNMMTVYWMVEFSGANTDGTPDVIIPEGLNVDTTALPIGNDTTRDHVSVGSWMYRDHGAAGRHAGTVVWDASNARAVLQGNNQPEVNTGANIPVTVAANDLLTVHFTVPIAEWAGDGPVTMSNSRVQFAADDGVGDVFGPNGALVPNVGDDPNTTAFDITFSTPQSTESYTLEINNGGSGWGKASDFYPFFAGNNGISTNFYGVRAYWTTSTNYRVEFGNRGTRTVDTSTTPGAVTWATERTAGTRYRIVRSSNPLGIGAGLATATAPGAIASYKDTTLNSLPVFESGTWTPVFTHSSGPSATVSAGTPNGFYTRIGNIVTFTATFAGVSWSGVGRSNWDVTIPVPTNIDADKDLIGTATGRNQLGFGTVLGDVANDDMNLDFYVVSVTNQIITISGQYQIK